ncbi:MAG: radical SAM protein, partial [Clostridia bacterium]|nr:radical SAM protein [Clostridia bacterium]
MVLDYLEIEISEFCNLNCKGCTNCSNIATRKQFYEFDEYSKDLHRISEIFSGIKKIRLLGGEPFLNPRIVDYAGLVRELFPDSDLRIVTNGLLLPRIDIAVLRELSRLGAFLDISAYPPSRKRRKQIAARLNEAGLGFNFGPPVVVFFKQL